MSAAGPTPSQRVELDLAALVIRNRVRAVRAAQDVLALATVPAEDLLERAARKAEQRRFLDVPALPSAFGGL